MSTTTHHTIDPEEIAQRAYFVFLDRKEKNLPGDHATDWLKAEALLSAETSTQKRSRLAPTPDAVPSEALNQIKGIGRAFIKKLNAAGIHGITQIADLSSEGVTALEASLKCKGRISRERWVEQARELLGR